MAFVSIRISRPEKATGIMMLAITSGAEICQKVDVDTSPPSVNPLAFIPKYEETKARGM